MGSVRGMSRIRLDDAIGTQHNSLRQTSARHAFSRSARFGEDHRPDEDTPGPGGYECGALSAGPSVVIGTARSAPVRSAPCTEPDPQDDYEAAIPDSGRFRFNAPPRAVFGQSNQAERGGKMMDTEFLRACPQSGYGQNSPGLVYSPDDKRVRPRSAPSYTIRNSRKAETSQKRSATPTKVAPNSYPGAREEAIGAQRNSRRRTASASSFGRAERFPAPKPASGGVSEDCMNIPRSDFGDRRVGARGSGSHATFGRATRDGAARTTVSRAAGDRPVSANLSRPRIPHPPVAPRQEIIRFGDNFSKGTMDKYG